MFFLPWWTYVLIGTVAFTCSFAAVWLAGIAFDRETPDDGPFPCGEHLGTDEDGAEDWCWQVAGHDGDHLGMRQDWSGLVPPTDQVPPLPDLPQRVSMLHNDPWPTCGHSSMNGTCDRAKGHPGEHLFMCF